MAKSRLKDFIRPYRITDGKGFRLKDVDPADTSSLRSEDEQKSCGLLQRGIAGLAELQEKLYAQDQ
jgi:hypothetical protein